MHQDLVVEDGHDGEVQAVRLSSLRNPVTVSNTVDEVACYYLAQSSVELFCSLLQATRATLEVKVKERRTRDCSTKTHTPIHPYITYPPRSHNSRLRPRPRYPSLNPHGEEMAKPTGTNASFVPYKETRLSVEPAYHSSIIHLPLPAHGLLNRTFSSPARRQQRSGLPLAEDENAFAQGHLATSSSVYVRKGSSSPRSILWRVLEGGKVLSVQSVDLNKSKKEGQDASLILRFSFPSPIRPGGIAFSDSEKHDPLDIFVLISSNDLYTLTVRSEFFYRAVATEGNTGDWCKTFLASSFSFRHPHRLIAHTPQRLLISTHDGGLLRLERNAGDDGMWLR